MVAAFHFLVFVFNDNPGCTQYLDPKLVDSTTLGLRHSYSAILEQQPNSLNILSQYVVIYIYRLDNFTSLVLLKFRTHGLSPFDSEADAVKQTDRIG